MISMDVGENVIFCMARAGILLLRSYVVARYMSPWHGGVASGKCCENMLCSQINNGRTSQKVKVPSLFGQTATAASAVPLISFRPASRREKRPSSVAGALLFFITHYAFSSKNPICSKFSPPPAAQCRLVQQSRSIVVEASKAAVSTAGPTAVAVPAFQLYQKT